MMNTKRHSSAEAVRAVVRARGAQVKAKAGERIPSVRMGRLRAAAFATAMNIFALNVPEAVEAIKDLSVVMLRPSRSMRSMKKRRALDLWEIFSILPSRWKCRRIRQSRLTSNTRATSQVSAYKIDDTLNFKIFYKLNEKDGGALWNHRQLSGRVDLGPSWTTPPRLK